MEEESELEADLSDVGRLPFPVVNMNQLTSNIRLLWRVWHRLNATCTADESWTNYIILSRHGIVNSTSASSRQYNPHAVLNIYK
jgi:hypothetical protein